VRARACFERQEERERETERERERGSLSRYRRGTTWLSFSNFQSKRLRSPKPSPPSFPVDSPRHFESYFNRSGQREKPDDGLYFHPGGKGTEGNEDKGRKTGRQRERERERGTSGDLARRSLCLVRDAAFTKKEVRYPARVKLIRCTC